MALHLPLDVRFVIMSQRNVVHSAALFEALAGSSVLVANSGKLHLQQTTT
jgi:hypothetical protein